MPEITAGEIEVSQAEERYLRGAFRRFALPYLGGLAALLALVLAPLVVHVQRDDVAANAAALQSAASADDTQEAQRAEIDALRESLAAALERVAALEQSLQGTAKKMSALEGRVGGSAAQIDEAEFSALQDELASARERIDTLEHRVSAAVGLPASLAR
ncbi:MAG: hypothetical protein OEM49_02970 [Myxococcales bacterium]|nr:hypothetical protein [Myxococcales bacterium]MDH5307326.1 hypothetical protein [Myxococcales bacterium]MDH5566055.1 hypothetical protein [Myxococcales bacterium]